MHMSWAHNNTPQGVVKTQLLNVNYFNRILHLFNVIYLHLFFTIKYPIIKCVQTAKVKIL